ncbi:cation-translocating P-type ATPase [Aurantimonas sp. A2-1-M11]|uniref:cation-translocating P-type ATPase n=1 Tax=Aurantimonas sp. A2-1-M11 TaxID=3113712 RepID=UPI002F935B13
MDHPADLALRPQGLTSAEAASRLASEGFNELPRARRRSSLRIVFDVLREPMLALLVAGGVVYFLLGNHQEAVILLVFASLSVGITVVQEARTERVLDALRDLTSPRALVIRQGERLRIAGREVARGDVIVLSEGDRVPADAALLSAQDLSADESLLTGEAVPVRKTVGPATDARPGGEDQPMVYSGSLIVRGTALATVTATGPASEIGRIGSSLGQLETETPHLQLQMRKLVIVFAAVGAAVSLAVVILYALLRGGWLEGVLAGIAVGMSMLPEEFPMVLAVFMAMGAWRISKVRVLTRRASAIETLGAASVLCTDKTGTLTENRMTISELCLADGRVAKVGATLPAGFRELVAAGVMASAPDPFDPMEKAFHALAKADLRTGETLPGTGQNLSRSYALSPDLLAMSQVWGAPGKGWQVAAKGAPEAIAVLCRLDATARAALTVQVDQMAGAGLRVLAVAEAAFRGESLPKSQCDFGFRLLGLVGLADPLRASVPEAVAQCRSAGIRVIMITGDYPATAQAIAADAGLQGDRVTTGPELAEMADADLATAVKDATIFARIMPEQKLRIVLALKAAGAVVAMTGDGVNDAPSLKAADIGVAMGGRGTDVAREAASIVLLDDDFGSIVTTVRLGRRIYDNLRKAMSFILAVHVPIAGLALMPLLFGMPILFGPVHIAFLEMVIDPVCSLVFEAETEEDGIMSRPPRPPEEPLFSGPTVLWSLLQGVLVLGVTATIFALAPGYGLSSDQVRGMTFAALVISIVALILVDRSMSSSILTAISRPNPALAVVLPIVGSLLAVTLFWQPALDLFGFAALEPVFLAVPPLAGLAVLMALELLKPLWRRAQRGAAVATPVTAAV